MLALVDSVFWRGGGSFRSGQFWPSTYLHDAGLVCPGTAALPATAERAALITLTPVGAQLRKCSGGITCRWAVVDRSGRSGSSALQKVSKFGTVASHQDRLPAYRSGALSRSGLERVNSAVEWHTQNRCFRTRKIVRIRGAHKGDGVGMQPVVREISHLYPAIFQKLAPTFFAPVRPIYPRAVNRSN